MKKEEIYKSRVWSHWIDKIKNSKHHTVFLHGIMGSELFDVTNNDTRWIDLNVRWEIDNLEFSSLSPDGAIDNSRQEIIARSTVSPPIIGDVYNDYFLNVGSGMFCYDWRDSIPIEAKRLETFLRDLFNPVNNHGIDTVSFVTHSMGGCVLLAMLANTSEFDNCISQIIFCAPPFHGSLKPIRVIEEGLGTPIDWLINTSTLKRSVASMPGLFQLLPAPENIWYKNPVDGINLKYPIINETSLFYPNALFNKEKLEFRDKLSSFAWQYYKDFKATTPNITKRLGGKINVIVGLNGKTPCMAQRAGEQWRIHSVPDTTEGKVANGDGTVLFQSSILPGLPKNRYWAFIPDLQEDTHGDLVNKLNVSLGINDILNSQSPYNNLEPYDTFSQKIDFGYELDNQNNPSQNDHLKYLERAKARSVTPVTEWGESLNPGGNDALDYHITRQAAYQVLAGDNLVKTAKRIDKSPEFLKQHIRNILLPLN